MSSSWNASLRKSARQINIAIPEDGTLPGPQLSVAVDLDTMRKAPWKLVRYIYQIYLSQNSAIDVRQVSYLKP